MAESKHISIRQAELNYMNPGTVRVLKSTVTVFRAVQEYLSSVVLEHWDDLAPLSSQKRLTCVEKLIHKTKDNPEPAYPDFDEKFYKLPSYIRRAAVNAVTGAVSSYKTRLADYESRKHAAMSNGKRFREKPPKFQSSMANLTLYKKEVFRQEGNCVFIKVFIRNTWDWIEVGIAGRDRKDLDKAIGSAAKVMNPSLVYKNHKFYLVFPLCYGCAGFPDTPLEDRTMLGVDLGINHGAVCSVIDFKGKVSFRAFDPFHRERSTIDAILRRIRYKQRKSGMDQKLSALYQKLSGVKENYVKQLARWIINLARENHVYGIVLERLSRMKARGSRKDRIHHWCKCRIRDYVRGLAFRYGIRVFQINPRNTSRLAFDGSGDVKRDEHNFSQCTFASGKQYHCDLGASYNIGARYFLRALEKSMSSEAWERLKAEVPELAMRTGCTLSTLWRIAETGASASCQDAA